MQLAQRVAQRLVLIGQHRENSGEDHWFDGFKSGERGSGARRLRDRVAHARIGDALDIGNDEADVTGFEFFQGHGLGRQRAQLLDFVDFVGGHQANLHVLPDAPFHHPHQHHRAAVNIEPGIKHQRLKGIFRAALRRRNALHNGFEDLFHAEAALGADQQRVGGGNGQYIFDLFFHVIGLRGGQVDFVDHRKNGEVVSGGEKRVRHGLRFHALARVHHQQRAFARGERAGNFVGKIDVARGVDQVQAIDVAVLRGVMQANAFGLDGDAALALQVHGIEHLLVHLALGEGAGHFQQPVGKGGFAVIDVRDDTKIAYELGVHACPLSSNCS